MKETKYRNGSSFGKCNLNLLSIFKKRTVAYMIAGE